MSSAASRIAQMELICFAPSGNSKREKPSIEQTSALKNVVTYLYITFTTRFCDVVTLKNDGHTLGSIQKQVEQIL